MSFSRLPLTATDPVAVAIAAHFQKMEAAGYGAFKTEQGPEGIRVSFGPLMVLGDSYDIALVRLAGGVLEDEKLGIPLMAALRVHQR